ncbi:beta-ketoacyl-[acyl-carrier-protein] synthase family protein [Morganella morganii]|uniref:beta-ketoacyl-[acyl-carrier-protein] synthase family protein n=1 Tax=Morganella morganii TaxID=582 RepID=UPI000BDD76D7|nr:beta-ketoacyl-[acyl-carrier-protein] synthase family protein [Morganella morganii]PCO26512.1 beta-ketoacyl-[acyl-carrier-protein] synthase II [Morganella morganii]
MIYINAVGMINALGDDTDTIRRNLPQRTAPGMKAREGWLQSGHACVLGGTDAVLPEIPAHLHAHDSRNNRLLLSALRQIQPEAERMVAQYGADRVAVILGTSTSGLDEADHFINARHHDRDAENYHYFQQELGDPARFLSAYLGLTGPAYTISTACSSSARAILSGQRLIDARLADAVIAGGADTLSRMPINGFNSLEALSPVLCQPFAQGRTGITIGEGAALLLLSREPADVAFLGGGESGDGYHMSAPEPEGRGAELAIRMALKNAGLTPEDIGYINLHGTGTPLNDTMESTVISRLFGAGVPCSSTKPLTGHMLGAAGAGEAALSWLILKENLPLPVQIFTDKPQDTTLAPCGLLTRPATLCKPVILSNSFAFGGNNCVLIVGSSDTHGVNS